MSIRSFSTSRCSSEQLAASLERLRPCQAEHRWTNHFCQTIRAKQECFKLQFGRCFEDDVAEQLVKNEKLSVRAKIEEDWGNKIPPEELEKLFQSCDSFGARPPARWERGHWLDHVQMDNSCDEGDKQEVRKLLTSYNTSLPNCLSEIESRFVLRLIKDNEVESKRNRQKIAGVAEPRTSGAKSAFGSSLGLFILLVFVV